MSVVGISALDSTFALFRSTQRGRHSSSLDAQIVPRCSCLNSLDNNACQHQHLLLFFNLSEIRRVYHNFILWCCVTIEFQAFLL